MIVTLTALIAATTLTAEAEAVAGDAPLDDLRVLTAVAEAGDAPVDGEDLDWLDLQGYAAPDVASQAAAAYARYRHGRAGYGPNGHAGRYGRGYGHGYGRGGQAGGGVFGPRKDGFRDQHGRFALNQGGFVSMPGPSGAGGRIAADALQADVGDDAPGTTDAGRGDGTTDGANASSSTRTIAAASTSAGSAPTSSSSDGDAGLVRSRAGPQSTSMLRLSFSKSYAPAGPAGDSEPVATPLPASALLFASGLGLFGVSRRRIR